MLSITSPLAPFGMSPFDSLMADVLTADDLMAQALVAPCAQRACAGAPPRLSATDDKYLVSLAVPGIKASDLEIEAIDGRLTVTGRTGARAVEYSFALPHDADANAAEAESIDGILTVTVPKKAAEPIHIAVSDTIDGDEIDDEPQPYKLSVVAAGLAAADIKLAFDDGELIVRGETARTGARLCRGYRLPQDADVKRAHAAAVDGILTVTVPKKVAAEPMRIAVNTTVKPDQDEAISMM